MSTFSGVVPEFPSIRIDNFQAVADVQSPLAYFVSHIHSDHIQGLENYRSPAFIYCSAVTRELLLQLEKYSSRRNFDNGILETKSMHFKHLASVLRPLPLNTPTNIQLTSEKFIRVTLLDANHCPGAVMFLIENGFKSILYTGDIRAEKWWLDNLLRNPFVIPYLCGLRTLNMLYLDTTHASKDTANWKFPSKADGMQQLLSQVARYPTDTVFHINTWTYGYEEALASLAAAFSSKIHADRYKVGIYKTKATFPGGISSVHSPFISGFFHGSTWQPGFLTTENSRFHACNPACSAAKQPDVVRITPSIGKGVWELGARPPLKRKRSSDIASEVIVDGLVFPFARHSSYQELCELVAALKPDDVYPCVVGDNWTYDQGVEVLFGDFCATRNFLFDREMARLHPNGSRPARDDSQITQETYHCEPLSDSNGSSPPGSITEVRGNLEYVSEIVATSGTTHVEGLTSPLEKRPRTGSSDFASTISGRSRGQIVPPVSEHSGASTRPKSPVRMPSDGMEEDSQVSIADSAFGSQNSDVVDHRVVIDKLRHRKMAYQAAKSGNANDWALFSTLSSAGRFDQEEELD